jgi:hypothetical protein
MHAALTASVLCRTASFRSFVRSRAGCVRSQSLYVVFMQIRTSSRYKAKCLQWSIRVGC